MHKPILLVIAGCNGSGKSSFSRALTPDNNPAYDYDLVFLNKYNSLIDTELKDRMAHNMSMEDLKEKVKTSIKEKSNFCYETNFNSTPLHWPKIFKQANYRVELTFFCLDSIEEAKKRVQIRVENGGHFVPALEIEKRYKLGFKHLNEHWKFFDAIHLFETSTYNKEPKHLLTIEQNELIVLENFPNYLKQLIPSLADRIK